MSEKFQVASGERVEAVLDGMAWRIHATLPRDLVPVGIRRRGVPLAEQLAVRLAQHTGRRPPLHEVTAKRYADDLTKLHDEPRLDDSNAAARDLQGRTVLLVDDVLFSGRTLLRVLQWVGQARPAAVRTAVLCARDTPEVPVRADFVGLQLDVGPRGVIDVAAPPYEDDWAVWLSHTS